MENNNNNNNNPIITENMKSGRNLLAIGIAVFSLIAIWVLGSKALGILDTEDVGTIDKKIQGLQSIIGSILPVIAAWMGTVIAFYFGRENFEAVTKSMQNVINKLTPEEKLKSIMASTVMLKYGSITKMSVQPGTLLKEIITYMNKENINRLPVFDASGIIQYCIHQSSFEKFISNFSLSNTDPALTVDKLTFENLTGDATFIKTYLEGSIQTVKPDATLLDAKKAMDSNSNCLDVFVTDDGTRSTKVQGWITNNKILENSNV